MTDREFGRALVGLDAAPPDARAVTGVVLARDRRRLRLLAGLAVVFWVVTAAAVVGVCPFYVMMVAPRLRAYHAGRAQLGNDWEAWATVGEWGAYLLVGCTLSFLAAALCTVALVLLSRRATLRQINAGLAEISEQLRQLRPPPAPPA